MNSMMNAAAAFPAQAQDVALTVNQLVVAGVLAAAIVGLILGVMTFMTFMTFMTNQNRDIVHSEVKPLVGRLDGVDARLDKIDIRLDKMDARFDKMDERMDKMDERMDRVETKLDKVADDVGVLVQVVTRLVEDRERGR